MQKEIKEYSVACGKNIIELNDCVASGIKTGYQPFGSLVIAIVKGENLYCQPMVIYKD